MLATIEWSLGVQDLNLKSAAGLLSLLSVRGIGDTTADKIVGRFSSFGEILDAPESAFKGVANATISATLRTPATIEEAHTAARRVIDQAEANGVDLISIYDDAYPSRLFDCSPRPMLLYVKGDLRTAERSVACVGTREPTEYGRVATDRITTFLAENGWAIVSGLAKGVDSIAHEAALRVGVPTIAVLGSGLDAISSPRAVDLGDRILDAGGCVVTEQPFGRENDAGTLIRRNRMQCGLSVATFMLQCDVESGTMHTVRYAISQGRPLYAPHTPARFADEDKNRGADIITLLNGRDLCNRIEMKTELRDRVMAKFADRPVASSIAGREDYPRILEELEASLTNASQAVTMPEQTLF